VGKSKGKSRAGKTGEKMNRFWSSNSGKKTFPPNPYRFSNGGISTVTL